MAALASVPAPKTLGASMALSESFNYLQLAAVGPVPGGSCDGLVIDTAGTISFTTLKGTPITSLAVVAGQVVPVRIKSVEAISSAKAYFGFHRSLP